MLGIDPGAAIDDCDFGHRIAGPCLDGDGAARGGGLGGVERQVVKYPFHQLGIERKWWNPRLVVFVDRDARRLLLHHGHRAVQRLRQVRFFEARLQRARELQEPRDQGIRAVHFGADKAGHFAGHVVFRADGPVQHFGGCLDGAQRVAQFVRQPRRKLPQGRQAVRPAYRLLGLPEMGVGLGELFRRAAGLPGLHPQILGECVGQVPHDGQNNQPQRQLVPLGSDVVSLLEQKERKIGAARQQRKCQRAHRSQDRCGGHHRKQQHQPVAAIEGARVPDQQVSQRQL